MLAALDLLVLLKICAKRGVGWSQRQLAGELGIAQGSVHGALRTAEHAGLYRAERRAVNRGGLEEALVHGARYFLAPERGGECRGMPTSWAAPPLRRLIADGGSAMPVWPDPLGTERGVAFSPLHRSVPEAARRDEALYEMLALVDALREGGARLSGVAARELRQRLEAS